MKRYFFAAVLGWTMLCDMSPLFAQATKVAPLEELPANFVELKKKASNGDPNAQFQLGQLTEDSARHLDPKAADQRYADAVLWYRAAADQGQSQALNNLGAMLVDGRGLPQDVLEGASYYRRAAQAGSAEAKTNLALLILKKRISGSDHEALADLTQACDAGFAPAEAQLAQIYLDGTLVSPDDAKAAELFRQSAEQHYGWGEYGYALMLQSGSGVSRDLAKAEAFMERAANGGLPPAEFDLSRMLDLGLGVAADKKRADLLLNSAAKQGEPRAQERLRQLQPPSGHPVS